MTETIHKLEDDALRSMRSTPPTAAQTGERVKISIEDQGGEGQIAFAAPMAVNARCLLTKLLRLTRRTQSFPVIAVVCSDWVRRSR